MRIGGGAVSIADVTDRTARDLGFVRPFWLNEIRAGRAFVHAVRLAASVGDSGHIQLFNPAGSGITVIPYRLITATDANAALNLSQHNTELGTDNGVGVNLLSGGPASAAHLRSIDSAVGLGTILGETRSLADTPFEWYRDWLMELGEGEGLVSFSGTANILNMATFFWIEI